MSKAAKRVHRLQLCRGPQDGGREHRLVALEVARLDQPQVRWHDVADVQDDNVTRDEVGDVDVGRTPSRSLRAGGSASAGQRCPGLEPRGILPGLKVTTRFTTRSRAWARSFLCWS
jgi:hypothetical protein